MQEPLGAGSDVVAPSAADAPASPPPIPSIERFARAAEDPLDARRRRVRRLDVAVSTLVGVAIAVVAVVATPPLLVAAGVIAPRPPAAAVVVEPSRRSDLPPFFHERDLEAEEDDVDRPLLPERRRTASDTDGGTRALGLARRELVLLDAPEEEGTPIGRVPGGETVLLVRDVGEWLLVVHSGADGTSMGWVQKNAIAVR